jgi:hypothetical protein
MSHVGHMCFVVGRVDEDVVYMCATYTITPSELYDGSNNKNAAPQYSHVDPDY